MFSVEIEEMNTVNAFIAVGVSDELIVLLKDLVKRILNSKLRKQIFYPIRLSATKSGTNDSAFCAILLAEIAECRMTFEIGEVSFHARCQIGASRALRIANLESPNFCPHERASFHSSLGPDETRPGILGAAAAARKCSTPSANESVV